MTFTCSFFRAKNKFKDIVKEFGYDADHNATNIKQEVIVTCNIIYNDLSVSTAGWLEVEVGYF